MDMSRADNGFFPRGGNRKTDMIIIDGVRFFLCCRCGKQFKPNHLKHQYCSKECREEDNFSGSRFVILERDDFQCFYCGTTAYEDRTELHVDHIVPFSASGKATMDNLVTSCTNCNLHKSTKQIKPEVLERMQEEIRKRNKEAGIPDDALLSAVDKSRERKVVIRKLQTNGRKAAK